MDDFETQRVIARQDGLLREDLGDDLVVYDTATDTAHLLNDTSRRVFEAAEHGTTVGALNSLFDSLPAEERRGVVLLALDQLRSANLVEEVETLPAGMTRRQLLRNMAIAAVAAPAVISIVAPTPAMATGTGVVTCTITRGSNCTAAAAPPNCCTTGNACTAPAGGSGQSKCCAVGSTDTKTNNQNCTVGTECCSGTCTSGKCVGP